jgi:hypothetical protein
METRLVECPACERMWRHAVGLGYTMRSKTGERLQYDPKVTSQNRATCPICYFETDSPPSSNDTNKNLAYRQRIKKQRTGS